MINTIITHLHYHWVFQVCSLSRCPGGSDFVARVFLLNVIMSVVFVCDADMIAGGTLNTANASVRLSNQVRARADSRNTRPVSCVRILRS